MTALSIAFQKLGHPVPLSNLVVDENKSSAQPAQPKTPVRCSSFSGLVNGTLGARIPKHVVLLR